MDKGPLNRAHQLERKAQNFTRHKKYDQAIEAHKEAAELFQKCLTIGSNQNIHESVQLQKEFNERQIRLLQLKKAYFERVAKEKKMNGISSKSPQKDVENLEKKIFQAMETHDSLIYYLCNKGASNNERQSVSTIEEGNEESPQFVCNKHPKDEATVIEELKVLSGQLRESVHGLLIQLDDRNKEVENLKERIKYLELEKSSKNEDNTSEESPKSDRTSLQADLSLSESTELASLPPLDIDDIPTLDLAKLREEFSVSEVNPKFVRKGDSH